MSTNSRIALELSDGSFLSAYHHWDGYPEWLGRILNTHYADRESVSELIDGGDMSTCWTKDRWTGKQLAPYVTENVEVEEYGPQYYSGRGEDCPPKHAHNLTELYEQCDNCGAEYVYIFERFGAGWICKNTRSWDDNYKGSETIPLGALAC